MVLERIQKASMKEEKQETNGIKTNKKYAYFSDIVSSLDQTNSEKEAYFDFAISFKDQHFMHG